MDVNAGQVDALAEAEPLKLKTESDDPFRILILGDFSGRKDSLSDPLRIDGDNLDDVMRALRVETIVSLGNKERLRLPFKFEELEHFEPDSLFRRCELFRLPDDPKPATRFASAAPAVGERSVENDAARLSSGTLLDAIVEQEASKTGQPLSPSSPASRDELQDIIERIVGPHLQPSPSFEVSQAAAARQTRLNILMRAILHETRFQALEAAWRSIDFLIRNIESDNRVQIYLFDISKEKLAADLLQNPEFRSTRTYRVIVEQAVRTPGAEPWALLVGNYAFDRNSASDVELLVQLGLLARAGRAPFLAEAVPSPQNDPAAFGSWQALRESANASWLGLAIPRLLLRLPYGKETARIESFDFEEMPDGPRHEEYVWGNPAFGCAYLLALSFSRFGWDFRPGMHREIADLPLHIYKKNGAMCIQPCAELLLAESDWNALLEEGLMPLACAKDADWARLIRFQSIANPPTALSGRWA